MADVRSCPTCGAELLEKNRAKLLVAGVSLFAIAAGSFFLPRVLWIAGLPFAVIGGYLVAWGTLGQGRWCRQCKKFPV